MKVYKKLLSGVVTASLFMSSVYLGAFAAGSDPDSEIHTIVCG